MTGVRSADGHAPIVQGLRDPRRLTAVLDTRRHAVVAAGDLHGIVEVLQVACAVPTAAIGLVAPGVQTYLAEVGIGAARTVFDDDVCPFAEIVEHGHPLEVPDLRQHSVYWRNPLVQQGRVVSFAGEPLLVDGAVVGAVAIFDSGPRKFSAEQIAALRRQAQRAGSVLERHHRGGAARTSGTRWQEDGSDEQPIVCAAVHQATGRLMVRFSIGPAEALMRLRELADRLGRPLPEVAKDVALGHLTTSQDGHVSAAGPTADTDLVLMEGHLASAGASTSDGLFDGPG